MDTIRVNAKSGSYNVLIGTNVGDALFEKVGDRRVCVVTDNQVYGIYQDQIKEYLPQAEIFVFKKGEKSKSEKTLFDILEYLLENDFDRSGVVVAFGGGVVGDIAGFASAIYMRGIDCIQVPTTLLSQVDSSVGGKTAINMNQIKNIVGSFFQPISVICDTAYLSTLEKSDITSGVGEIVKTACLDKPLYDFVKANIEKIFALDTTVMEEVIAMCIQIKADVVSGDEKEKNGLRKKLNLGHTIGHAFESSGIFGSVSHGECVLCGIYIEALMAKEMGRIEEDYLADLLALVEKSLGYVPKLNDIDKMVRVALKDKKNHGHQISLIIPVDFGETDEVYITAQELETMLEVIDKKL